MPITMFSSFWCSGILPLFTQQATYHILMGLASHGLAGVASLIGSLVGAGLSILFVGVLGWGIEGAALATAIPVFVVNICVLPYAGCRAARLPLLRYLRESVVSPVLSVIPFALVLLAARVWLLDDPRPNSWSVCSRRSSPGRRLLAHRHAGRLEAKDPPLEASSSMKFLSPARSQGRMICPNPPTPAATPRNRQPSVSNALRCALSHRRPTRRSQRREDLAHVGGAERQQVLLGEELVQRGYPRQLRCPRSRAARRRGDPRNPCLQVLPRRRRRPWPAFLSSPSHRAVECHEAGRCRRLLSTRCGVRNGPGRPLVSSAHTWIHLRGRARHGLHARTTICRPDPNSCSFGMASSSAHAVIAQTVRQQSICFARRSAVTSTVIRSCSAVAPGRSTKPPNPGPRTRRQIASSGSVA